MAKFGKLKIRHTIIDIDMVKDDDSLGKLEEKKATFLTKINRKINDARRNTKIKCPTCGKFSKISKMDYCQTYWYESPHGCTGGDNWWPGEINTFCLHCNETIRINHHAEFDYDTNGYLESEIHRKISNMRYLFKNHFEKYGDSKMEKSYK